MVRESLNESVVVYRPTVAQNTSAKRKFTSARVFKVKFDQPSGGSFTDTTGAVMTRTATLYFNIGRSYFLAPDGFEERFRAGDLITIGKEVLSSPPEERFVVKRVTEHRHKGVLHHYEVSCV